MRGISKHPLWIRLLGFPVLMQCLGLAGAQSALPDLPELSLEPFSASSREVIQLSYERVREAPTDAGLNGELAMQLHTYEQYQAAETCYKRAHLLDPQRFQWIYLLGVVQDLSGKKEESVASLRQAMSLNPDYLPGKVKLAEALFNSDLADESIRLFEGALRQEPESALACYGLGRALLTQGKTQEAVPFLEKALQLYGEFGSAHYSLGLAFRDLGERDKARQHLALYRQHQNKWPASNDFFQNWVKSLKQGPLEHLSRGVSLAENHLTEEAIQEHLEALELDPGLTQAHINLIRLYGELGKWEDAEYHCSKALELQPDVAEIHYNRGVLMISQNRNEEAGAALRRALEINPHFAHAHNNLGTLLLAEGKLDEAASHFQAALDNDPSLRLARFNLGRARVAAGKYDEAIQEFSKSLTPEDQETPRFLFALAAAYVRKGDLQKGLEFTQTARMRAVEWDQAELVESIDRDLQRLQRILNPR